MFIKIGQQIELNSSSIQSGDAILCNDEINQRFQKFAKDLKKLAPKSSDFLYFSTRYITAAEASLINKDGSPKLDKNGQQITAKWEPYGNGGLKWICSDPTITPYKNQNGDIFPEFELLANHKKWISTPLCIDHKSDSVDAVRGIVLDSYYDLKNKYAVALIALDKVSFPELANGIRTGYKSSVSMGTRVSRAICYDCGVSASNEREFCDHMRQKRAFGEINIGLDPIEISIVVNGADPQAKIRTILAAANNLRASLDVKEQEINKLSSAPTSASKFLELEEDLRKISQKILDLKASLDQDEENKNNTQEENNSVFNADLINNQQNVEITANVLSNNNALRSELQDLKNSVNSKFQDMEESLTTLSHKIKEEIMSVNSKDGMNKEGYFQGAGGVNEPAPHQVKYPKDPMNENLRSEDKHMVGVNGTGPVENMFPGDKEKKELVQRAEIEERAMRRAAALQKAKENLMKSKEAYFQGGGEGNEPTPGKPKYKVDPLDGKDREKEDKQMVGKKPFPGVGDVEDLYEGDKKKKELLQRASLKARFVRVASEDGTQDLSQSGWQVSRDGDVLFTATVDEITGGNVDALYDVVASKDFGTKLLEKVYKLGAEKTASLYKGAQAAPAMEATPAPAEAPMAEMAPSPAAEENVSVPVDNGAEGDPKEVALELAEEMRDRASDLLEAVRALTGEQAEMGELEGLTQKASAQDLKPLVKMKKTLNASLVSGMKKAVAELNEHREELNLIVDILNDGSTKSDYTNTIVEEALIDAKSALADVRNLMSAFVKYAHGSEQLAKQAQLAEHKVEDHGMVEDHEMADDELSVEDEVMADDMDDKDEDMNQVMMDVDPNSLQGKKVEIKAASVDLSTKEARAELRAKLAAESVQFSPVLDEANDLANGQTKLDVKPSDDLGKVETLEEQHAVSLEVAEAPPKVRKEAARLNELIAQGKVKKADLDSLVAQGLDASVVKYWKQFYGQAGKEGSEFASELLKEHAKAQIDEEVNKFKVKIARAYELTNEMVRRGLVADERSAITAHVEDMMQWNDEGFEAMKRVVNKHPLRKAASFPQIGLIGSGDPTSQNNELSLQDALDQAFSSRRY